MEELWDDYLEFLIWRCQIQKLTRFGRLFEILHHVDFEWELERDENRESDGVDLRDEYDIPDGFDEKTEEAFYARRCSVLEMLIGLAIRVDDEFIGDPAEEHPEIFFMEMIENLGLDKFKGNRYTESDVIKIVNRWMHRDFERNGRGSPFPVKKSRRDQRKLEIWDQMNTYISENYN